MIRKIAPLTLIFLCTAVAWMVLGAGIFDRTARSGTALKERVQSTWGTPQEQITPRAYALRAAIAALPGVAASPFRGEEPSPARPAASSASASMSVATPAAPPAVGALPGGSSLPLESSRIRVSVDLDPRQKGLLWYSTYGVSFDGTYRFRNPGDGDRVRFCVPLPSASATYDDFLLTVDGNVRPLEFEKGTVLADSSVPPGGTATLRLAYKSRGLAAWRYSFGTDPAPVRDFGLALDTNFRSIDFPDDSLSPSEEHPTARGWRLGWSYRNLVSGNAIAVTMPENVQPGPVAGRISYFAPVSLFFFFFVLFLITTVRRIDLHPMNYFLLAAAFFSFHLLLAYLVDHVSIHAAFVISSMVSMVLVVSYLRLVVGMRFAALEAGLTQLIYLVLLSYAFFFPGYTGLTVTVGAVLTLFAVMQLTGRIRWAEKFA